MFQSLLSVNKLHYTLLKQGKVWNQKYVTEDVKVAATKIKDKILFSLTQLSFQFSYDSDGCFIESAYLEEGDKHVQYLQVGYGLY